VSELSDNLSDIVQDRASFTTTPVLNLRTGITFPAEIEGNLDPFIVPDNLAKDKREVVKLYIQDSYTSGILLNDLVRFNYYGKTSTCIIADRGNDPGSPLVEFWAVQKLKKDS